MQTSTERKKMKIAHLASILTVLILTACAAHVTKPESEFNPPPASTFNHYKNFELLPVNEQKGCDKQHGADTLFAKLNSQLSVQLAPKLANWSTQKSSGAETLVIEPVCTNARLIGVAARIFTGPFSGSSVIVLSVRYTERSTGKVIAEPVFYQRAAAGSGGFTFGTMDQIMMSRMTKLITDYTVNNYSTAVGGRTGLEKEDVATKDTPAS
ncbi:hypothetical protein ACO0LO_27405 [Undibacterium sp. TJN25]|uniref:hypothetical protein n=1 Tax=Undibacterium sp. TJN25 TaxID=3413056 RepID=UPI003BEFC517